MWGPKADGSQLNLPLRTITTSSSAIAERPREAQVEFKSHPFGGVRGNVDASCVRRWKKHGRLPIGDN